MGLKLKKFTELYSGMVSWIVGNTTKLTDFSKGSAIRSLLEAIATSIEQAYFNMYRNVMWGIENSIYEAFNFRKKDATPSSGTLTLMFSYPVTADFLVPEGTRFASITQQDGSTLYFHTREDYKVLGGSIEADIEVFCTTAGKIGNVSADTIKVMVNPIREVSEITNRVGFTTGAEEESSASRKQRFNRYIETLARGTKKAIEYGAKEVEGVAGVWVDDSEVGLVKVYVHDANGNLPDYLKTEVQTALENYRAAGIPCLVLPIIKEEIKIELEVSVLQAYNTTLFRQNLLASLYSYVNNFPVAKSFIVSDLVQYVMNYDDVAVTNCKVLSPTQDIITPQQEIIRASEIKLTIKT